MIEQYLFIFLDNLLGGVEIHPQELPASANFPALSFELSNRDFDIPVSGSGITYSEFEISCYSSSIEEAQELGNQVIESLQNFKGDMNGRHITLARITNVFDTREPETGAYVRHLTLSINNSPDEV